jgi:tetratricopeptide (TPR) repeat protein
MTTILFQSQTRLSAAVMIIAAATFAATVGGCAAQSDKLAAARRRGGGDDDASFAAGSGRAPTAATSFALARILIGQGRDRDALYILSRTVRDDPNFVPAYNEIAGIYVRSDRLDDAIATLAGGLKQSPQDTVLHNNLGMCHFLKGDAQEALKSFDDAATRMPHNPLYRANRAAALAMLGREAEAEADYRNVVDEAATRANLSILARARADRAAAGASAQADEPSAQADEPRAQVDPAETAVRVKSVTAESD